VTMNGGASRRRPNPRASRTRDTARAIHDGGTGIPSASRARGAAGTAYSRFTARLAASTVRRSKPFRLNMFVSK
jgi:hypothetical protein